MLRLLQEDATEGAPASGTSPGSETEREEDSAFLCAVCEAEISWRRALFAMRASSFVQVFPNPLGHMKVIYTFRDAASVRVAGGQTTEFTWFAGYAWSVAYCARCNSHLGWLFQAVASAEPSSFFGLLKDALVERTSRSA